MMKVEASFPMDLEIKTNQLSRKEQIWLTEGQYEILVTVIKIIGQTISEYITETIISLLECEVQDTIPHILMEKLQGKSYQENNL